jgi:hypothetical protein
MLPWKKIIIGLFIILLDLLIGLILGILLMDYDDFYQESKGEYWSWDSMNTFQKQIYFGMNLWWGLNVIAIGYIIYRILKKRKTRYNIS